jgi:hypothetical protein
MDSPVGAFAHLALDLQAMEITVDQGKEDLKPVGL